MSIANIMIAVGLVFIVLGMAGLVYCIALARRIRGMDPEEVDMKPYFYRISAVNMAAMGGAFLGLAVLLVGLILD